ncbi:DUF2795 domain-containing protein [Burkholderia glumae]|nr:DUF2795 domain-containing protein [Burkholderia glumae]QJW81899.1 DUF2795 domain-containing protein [Burkholderia glumae]RQZ73085.1 DUF2795 domain-containing protein [Burkholderia glumae]UVS87357.1 DUF2795 domain-containing protein [Burkholderia glumae]
MAMPRRLACDLAAPVASAPRPAHPIYAGERIMTSSPSQPRQAGHGESNDGHASPIDLQKALKGVAYPAVKADLVKHARDGSADDAVLDLLLKLPDGEYETPAAVSKAVGKLH